MPNPADLPVGCRFADRCPKKIDICVQERPKIYCKGTQQIACHLNKDWEEGNE